MRHIFAIYTRDIHNVMTNWVALVIIGGLIFLPSLYAWFNIKASWDPYGNTSQLSIAVANKDEGAMLRDKELYIGDEIIKALHDNHSINWIFTDEAEATRGVTHGDYYASITIPADMSSKIASVITPNPQKAEIIYQVNEKINAISPKVTAKGASSIIEQVNENFVETASTTIFQIMNELGVELETELPNIRNLTNLIFKLETMFPDINQTVTTASDDLERVSGILDKMQQKLPTIAQVATDGQDLTAKLSEFFDHGEETIGAIGPDLKNNLLLLQQVTSATEQLTGMLQDVNINKEDILNPIVHIKKRLTTAVGVLDRMIGIFQKLNNFHPTTKLTDVINKLDQVKGKFNRQIEILNSIYDLVDKGEKPTQDLINSLNQLSKDASAILGDLIVRWDREITPQIVEALQTANRMAKNANDILKEASASLPDVSKILNDAIAGTTFGEKELKALQGKLPTTENKIKQLANKIRTLEKETNLQEVIDLLKLNAQREGDFWANPVLLKEIKLFPIPNYGSAMSPFFSTLSLWVGALLLVSLLTVEVHQPAGATAYRSYEIYFGRYLTFMTFAALQSVFVTLGDIYLLGCYVTDKLWFVLFGILLSIVFMLIVYTLVSVFGNVGKAIAIVLLVLQLAGSGGTFPIQLTPPFFQMINPYLPFTYGISMMREAVGGILWDIVQRDMLKMLSYAAIALLIGLALKRWINRGSESFVQKAKKSGLIH